MAARSWNRVELMGNLTRDPELRYTPNGAAVCTFGLATNRSYMAEGERKEEVDFHQIVTWNKLAELCNQLLKKGSRVFVSGRLQYREWDGQDGQKRRVAEIVCEDMIQLTSRAGSPETASVSEMVEAAGFNDSAPTAKSAPQTKSFSAAKPADDTPPASNSAPKADETVDTDDLPF